MLNLYKNFKNSLAGIRWALSDKSFKGQIALGFLTIPWIVFAESIPFGYKYAVIVTYAVLVSVELLNTAIEVLCDRITTEFDEAIKEVKDIASSAVFIVLMLFLAQCAYIYMYI